MWIKPKRLLFWGVLLCAVIILGIYAGFDPADAQFFPKCPFKALTGFDCPGCGSQRAFHCLLRYNIAGAFRANPLFVCSLPYVAGGFYFDIFPPKTPRALQIRNFFYGLPAIIVVFFVVVAYWVLRNVI
jgi:hypothetical protein